MQFSDLARQHNRQSSLMEAERCGAESARRRTLYFRGKRRGVVGRQSVHLVSSGPIHGTAGKRERNGCRGTSLYSGFLRRKRLILRNCLMSRPGPVRMLLAGHSVGDMR